MIPTCPVCGKEGDVMIFLPFCSGKCYEADQAEPRTRGFQMVGGFQEELPMPDGWIYGGELSANPSRAEA